MKLIKAKKLKKLLNNYAMDLDYKHKNRYIYSWFRGIYDSRILGWCIYRNVKIFNELFKK